VTLKVPHKTLTFGAKSALQRRSIAAQLGSQSP
jgi:hypothetical protein